MFQPRPLDHREVCLRSRGGGQCQPLLHGQPVDDRGQAGELGLQQGEGEISAGPGLAASLTDLLQDFLCNCDRCADETENETYLSALRCVKCPGYFLPKNPLGKKHTGPVRVASLQKKNL